MAFVARLTILLAGIFALCVLPKKMEEGVTRGHTTSPRSGELPGGCGKAELLKQNVFFLFDCFRIEMQQLNAEPRC